MRSDETWITPRDHPLVVTFRSGETHVMETNGAPILSGFRVGEIEIT